MGGLLKCYFMLIHLDLQGYVLSYYDRIYECNFSLFLEDYNWCQQTIIVHLYREFKS